MKFKTTIILVIVALVGAAYVFLYEKKQQTFEEKQRFQNKVFYGLDTDSINKIEVLKEGKPFVFEKAADETKDNDYKWMIKKPIETRGDKALINGFLSELEFIENVSSFGGDGDVSVVKNNYGFDKPTFEITMWVNKAGLQTPDGSNTDTDQLKTQEKITFYIGDRVSTGTHVYLQFKGSKKVLVVDDLIARKLDYNINGFRDKWLMIIDEDAVSKLDVINNDSKSLACYKDGKYWRMSTPVTDRCDNKKIGEIIKSLKELKIEEEDFITDSEIELARYGLVSPKIVLKLTQNNVEQSIFFGHTLDNKVYVKRSDETSVFMLKSIITDELTTNPDNLRSRELVHFETLQGTFGVNRIVIHKADSKLTIEKTEEYDWQITEPVNMLADMDIVKELVEETKELRILDFVDDTGEELSQYGLDVPVFDYSIFKEGQDEPTRILLGNKTVLGNHCYAKRPGEKPVFTITSTGLYKKLAGGILTFHDKLVTDFDKDSMKELTIEKNGIIFNVVKNEKLNDLWKLTSPINGTPDNDVIDQIVHDLSFQKAEKYTAQLPVNLNEFGLESPHLKVSVSCEITAHTPTEEDTKTGKTASPEDNGNSPQPNSGTQTAIYKLSVGNKVGSTEDSNYYAIAKGNNFVFELNHNIVKLLGSELISKSIQKFSSTKAKRLVLTYPDNQIVFERPTGNWKPVKPPLEGIEEREIEFLIWILSNLTADNIKEYNLNNVIKYRLNNPDIKAVVHLDDNSFYEILASKAENNNEYYVLSRNTDCIYSVEAEIIDKLIDIIPAANPTTPPTVN